MPRYLWADLTGLPNPILVVPVAVDPARGTLNDRPIRLIPLHETDTRPDDVVGANCLGLAFFHGLSGLKKTQAPSEVFLLYECFSGYSRVRKGSPLMRRLGRGATGDGLLLELETGGQLLVYWKRDRYVTILSRKGD